MERVGTECLILWLGGWCQMGMRVRRGAEAENSRGAGIGTAHTNRG